MLVVITSLNGGCGVAIVSPDDCKASKTGDTVYIYIYITGHWTGCISDGTTKEVVWIAGPSTFCSDAMAGADAGCYTQAQLEWDLAAGQRLIWRFAGSWAHRLQKIRFLLILRHGWPPILQSHVSLHAFSAASSQRFKPYEHSVSSLPGCLALKKYFACKRCNVVT